MNIEIIECNFNNTEHLQKLSDLTAAYMVDPMGGEETMTEKTKQQLVEGLKKHPACLVLFAVVDGHYAGIITSFVNFSTFKAKPYFNVHDIAVLSEFRGKGVGKTLLEKLITIARERNYCKVTLEVRNDNVNAQKLYNNLGFKDCEPAMYFWTKTL